MPRDRTTPTHEPGGNFRSLVSVFRGRAAEYGGLVGIEGETGSERLGLELDAQFRVPSVRQVFTDMVQRGDRGGEELPWIALVAIQVNLSFCQVAAQPIIRRGQLDRRAPCMDKVDGGTQAVHQCKASGAQIGKLLLPSVMIPKAKSAKQSFCYPDQEVWIRSMPWKLVLPHDTTECIC